MAARFCQYCGQPFVPGAAFCSSCGAAVASGPAAGGTLTTPPPLTFGAPVPYSAYPRAYPPMAPPTSAQREAEARALSNVSLAALLGLIGGLASFLILLVTPVFTIANTDNLGSGSTVSIDLSGLYLLLGLALLGIVLSFIELWLYRTGFRGLSGFDATFSTPATMVVLAMVGLALIVVAGAGLFVVFYQATLCAGGTSHITSACINAGATFGCLALIGVGGLVALVGFIGLILGIWRLGTHFGDGLFKAGAILTIIPFLNFVGLVLIIVAARSARARIALGSPAGAFG